MRIKRWAQKANNMAGMARNPYGTALSIQTRLRKIECSRVSDTIDLEEALDQFSVCLVHSSYKAVLATFKSFDVFLRLLASGSRGVLVPGFTPSIRNRLSGFNDTMRPEVGMSSVAAQKMGLYRSFDPLHSFFFLNFPHDKFNDQAGTFDDNSPLRLAVQPGSCWLNVGTNELVSTAIHLIEWDNSVPYIVEDYFELHPKDGAGFRCSSFRSFSYHSYIYWNRWKLSELLRREGALKDGRYGNAYVCIVDGFLAYNLICDQLRRDPYWLIRSC